jgi:PPOX class probable F420-dependent enzyme
MMDAQQVYRARHGMPEHAQEFLARRVYAVLATENPDGSPHTVPLMFVFDGERFLFESRSTTRKVRNVEATGHARVLVQNPPQMEGWIAAEGPAHVVSGDAAQRLNRHVAERYLTEEGRNGWAATMASVEDVTIILEPRKWSAWDVSAMFETIARHGYREEQAMAWFHALDP